MKKREKEEKKIWEKAAWDMLYLTECGVNSTVPESERVAQMDLRKVFILSRRQSLEAITYMALESLLKTDKILKSPDTEEVLAKWEESKNKIIRRTLLMDAERARLFEYLEKQKIWHLPLKGIILCSMYPKFGMRQMTDNDILFDASYRQMIHDWFVEQGYSVEYFEKSNHDVYRKKPVYYFEMHTALFHENTPPHFREYYSMLTDRLKSQEGRIFEYQMNDEDFYIYMLAHTYKHYSNFGTGLRSLLDVYVYNRAKPQIDRKYLDKELMRLELFDFEQVISQLSFKTFASHSDYSSLTEKEKELLGKFLFSGVYGTIENVWKKRMQNFKPDVDKISDGIKIKYLLRRVVPARADLEKWCKDYAPFFLKNRCLLPAAYVWRIVSADRKKVKRFKKEIDTVRKM